MNEVRKREINSWRTLTLTSGDKYGTSILPIQKREASTNCVNLATRTPPPRPMYQHSRARLAQFAAAGRVLYIVRSEVWNEGGIKFQW